uniref:Gustatory receptor n=1 Tax=Anopheles coluzzii TaxID=1518534 RepID=A0A6E8VYU7_ANOCL
MRCIRVHLAYMGRLGLTMVKYDSEKHTFNSVQNARFKFSCLFAVALISSGYLIWRSPMDYSVYKFDSKIFDITIFIINTIITNTIYIILPLQCYCKHHQLANSLNALLINDSILRRLALLVGKEPPCYTEATYFSFIMRWDGIFFFSFFFCSYFMKNWVIDEFVHLQLSVCIYLAMDLALGWTLGLCCVVMLVGIEQLSHIIDLLLKASDERAIAPELISPILWDVYDRVTIHVRKDLSQYCGPIVVLFTSLFVLECAISLVDLGGLLYDGSDLDMSLIAVGALWLLFDFKKFIVPLLLSECLKQKVEETALCTRHFDDYRLQNTRAAKQIQKFLLKNLHQKKKFSACGFFDIDNTVIYMVFSSIVTYLVILIQFKQLETDLTQAGDGYNVTSNVSTVQP